MRDVADARVLACAAVSELVRAFHAQEFFDRGFDQLRMVAQARRIASGISNQQIDAVADQVGGGLMTGVEHEDAIVQQFNLGQPFAAVVD